MKEPKPITRASFIEARVDEYPYVKSIDHVRVWDALHTREVLSDEHDEDPR